MKLETRLIKHAVATISIALMATNAFAGDFKDRNLKMAIVNPMSHIQGIGATVFSEELAKLTEGKNKVKVFPGGTLGGEQEVISSLGGGTIECATVGSTQFTGRIRQFAVVDFPFLFNGDAHADAVLDGPMGKKLLALLPEKGIVGLGYQQQGVRSFSNNKRPIMKLEDLAGLKIRTIQNPLYIDMLKALGANPIAMPFPELYTALETNTVDGQENPEQTMQASKFYEVQKYFSKSGHIYNVQTMVVSKKVWDTFTEDEKKAWQEASNRATAQQRKAARAAVDDAVKFLKAQGLKMNDIAPAEIARMREKVQPVIDKYAKEAGEDFTKEFLAEVKKYSHLK